MCPKLFYRVNLEHWLFGTIRKHQSGMKWNPAWMEAYREHGGKSESVARKACPMIAAKYLYIFGRVRNSNRDFVSSEALELWKNGERNAAYAIFAVKLLYESPNLTKAELWSKIRQTIEQETGTEPARSDQGAVRLAYQLWHLGLIADRTLIEP